MKRLLVLISVFLASACVGLVIGVSVVMATSDQSLDAILQKFTTLDWMEIVIPLMAVFIGLYIGAILHIIVHEAGHLVAGLKCGYKFVSFRILNLTFVKENGKLTVKRFGLKGTGGQCLLTPPDIPTEDVPVVAYNLGGVTSNILLSAVFVALGLLFKDSSFASTSLLLAAAVGIVLALMNGIPMKLGGFPNDGYNALKLNKNKASKNALLSILRANALVQYGTRPSELSDNLFKGMEGYDSSNPLEANHLLFYASVLDDRGARTKAESIYRDIANKNKGILQLEAKCGLAVNLLLKDRTEEAKALLDKRDMVMVNSYKKMQSSKMTLLCLLALKVDKDREKAESIYNELKEKQGHYLMQGEVRMDLTMMERVLNI